MGTEVVAKRDAGRARGGGCAFAPPQAGLGLVRIDFGLHWRQRRDIGMLGVAPENLEALSPALRVPHGSVSKSNRVGKENPPDHGLCSRRVDPRLLDGLLPAGRDRL